MMTPIPTDMGGFDYPVSDADFAHYEYSIWMSGRHMRDGWISWHLDLLKRARISAAHALQATDLFDRGVLR